jgi:hypothetical protein
VSTVGEGSGDARDRRRDRVRRAVARLVDGTELQMQELKNGIVITNPGDPEKGRLHVALDDGYACWERVVWEYWGKIEGLEAPAGAPRWRESDEDWGESVVTREKITEHLT